MDALVSGSSAAGGDDIWPIHKQAPEVVVGAWCITVIELIMHQKTVCCAPSNPITALLMVNPTICASLIGRGSD